MCFVAHFFQTIVADIMHVRKILDVAFTRPSKVSPYHTLIAYIVAVDQESTPLSSPPPIIPAYLPTHPPAYLPDLNPPTSAQACLPTYLPTWIGVAAHSPEAFRHHARHEDMEAES